MSKAGLLLALKIGTAAAAVGSAVETREQGRRTRHTAEDVAKAASEEAATAAEEATAAETLAAEEAEDKKRKRAQELATGGRAAQFRTGPLGVSNQATVGKKTLLGA